MKRLFKPGIKTVLKAPPVIASNPKIKKAAKVYDSETNRNCLLEDFGAATLDPNIYEAVNPWQHMQRKKNFPSPRGLTIRETEFENIALGLTECRPTDVINELFFMDSIRNDSLLECSLVLPYFYNLCGGGKSLVVNPSPSMIKEIEKSEGMGEVLYAVPDKLTEDLYNHEFECERFMGMDGADRMQSVDYMLIITREKKWQEIFTEEMLAHLHEDGEVILCIQASELGTDKREFRRMLDGAGLRIRELMLLPKDISMSPKMKMLILAEKKCMGDDGETVITIADYDQQTMEFTVSDSFACVSHSEIMRPSETIYQLYKRTLEPKNTSKQYEKGKLLPFSKEILVSYNFYPNRKGKKDARVYYRATIDLANPLERGRRITGVCEKGFRADTEERVLNAIAEYPFREDVYPIIAEDIRENWSDSGFPLTLKTAWYLMRGALILNKKYDENTAREMFCKGDSLLGDLKLDQMTGPMILAAIETDNETDEERYALRIQQLDIILSKAVEEGFTAYNPMSEYVSKTKSIFLKKAHEVISALVYKALTQEQEQILVSECVRLGCGRKVPKGEVPVFDVHPIYLTLLIRLFTGMQNREVCALSWGDIITSNRNTYFRITKYLDHNTMISYANEEDWKRYRCVPICRYLYDILMALKDSLTKKGFTTKELAKNPIIMTDTAYQKFLNGEKIWYPLPETVANISKKLLKTIRVDESKIILPDADKEMEVDIYKYHGDIFTSTFKIRADSICRMEGDDISYIIGNKPSSTLAGHYEDMTADPLQRMLWVELERWCHVYSDAYAIDHFKETIMREKLTKEVSIGPFRDNVAKCEIIIERTAKNQDELTLYVDCEYGFAIELIGYKE